MPAVTSSGAQLVPAGTTAPAAVGRRTAIIGQTAARWTEWLRSRARRMALGLAVAALLETGALALSVFLVMEGVRLGFL